MRRELNEIEYLNWCFGQPYNMVIAVQLRGDLPPERLREALAWAQRRHPLLGVNTEIGPAGLPWFSSEGVGEIPLAVVRQAEPERPGALVESELASTFARDEPGSPRPPLIRATLLPPSDPARPCDLLFTVQHVIADGLSMLFLVRDLLRFMDDPAAPVEILDAPVATADLLPARVRRHTATSPLRVRCMLWLLATWARLTSGRRAAAPPRHVQRRRSWELTPEQTTALRARCRREGVSVQSALCAAFLPGFHMIHTPVNLRSLLARPVGESVGLYVGSADIGMKYVERRGFWGNARGFHRKLREALRHPFRIFQICSKAVPAGLIQRLGRLLMVVSAGQHPLGITNLGVLKDEDLQTQRAGLKVESFSGAVTPIVDSSVLTVYTVGGRLRLHLLANESPPLETAVQDEAGRAVQRLLGALD